MVYQLYFFFLGIFISLSVFYLFIWIGRIKDLNHLAFSIFAFIYSAIITIYQISVNYPEKLLQYVLPIIITILLSTSIPFLGYTLLNKKRLRMFFLLSSLGVILFSCFMVFFYLKYNINILLTQLYYTYVSIWPILGTVIVIYYFIKNKYYKNNYSLLFFVNYIITLICINTSLILVISGRGYKGTFVTIQSTIFALLMFIIAFVSSKKFNEEYKNLEEFKTTLESKVKKRTKQLEDSQKQKTDFFINFAHETRTPLILISNYLKKDIQKRGYSNEIRIVEDNFDFLLCNMNNILDFEKLERKQKFYNHNQPVNISDMIIKKIDIFMIPAKNKNIEINHQIDKNLIVNIDPFAFDRILNNLFDNAIRYSKNHGKIFVNLTSDVEFIILEISDTGIGMSNNKLNKIFEPYYQISHMKYNVQGMGIGLNIVKKIVDEIEGKIDVISNIDKGTKFTIYFKKSQNQEAPVSADIELSKPINKFNPSVLKEESYTETKQTIFIVDDNIEHLFFLQSELLDQYNVFVATNGQLALEKLKFIPKPNLIIADIMMDIIDGYNFYIELIKSENYKGTPLIFLTALIHSDEKIKGLSLGAVDFISKPYDINELKAKIKSLINLSNEQELIKTKEVEKKIVAFLQMNTKQDNNFSSFKKCCKEYKISPKEEQIIILALQGFENKEISHQLNVSINTLKTHMKNIYKKCNVQNKVELVNVMKSIK